MGTFNTQKLLNGNPQLIPAIASKIESTLTAEGYNVLNQQLISGAADISISKGGLFKAVLGMKTALKVTLKPQDDKIFFDASVGIFGQQLIPTLIMLFITWPVLVTQIWGLVKQSKLDDKVLATAEDFIRDCGQASSSFYEPTNTPEQRFCTVCGCQISTDSAFCPKCGTKL